MRNPDELSNCSTLCINTGANMRDSCIIPFRTFIALLQSGRYLTKYSIVPLEMIIICFGNVNYCTNTALELHRINGL